jgi:hypothetical protein
VSAVQDKLAFVCPACFNPTPLTEVVTLSRFSSLTGPDAHQSRLQGIHTRAAEIAIR